MQFQLNAYTFVLINSARHYITLLSAIVLCDDHYMCDYVVIHSLSEKATNYVEVWIEAVLLSS